MSVGGSYLKSLVPTFGECVDKFLDRLRPLADGKTQVPMMKHIHTTTLDVISKVGNFCIYTHTQSNNIEDSRQHKTSG